MLGTTIHNGLHLSQPGRHGSRIKPHAGADPETGDTTSFRQFENRDARHGQHLCEFVRRQCTSHSFDPICQAQRFRFVWQVRRCTRCRHRGRRRAEEGGVAKYCRRQRRRQFEIVGRVCIFLSIFSRSACSFCAPIVSKTSRVSIFPVPDRLRFSLVSSLIFLPGLGSAPSPWPFP